MAGATDRLAEHDRVPDVPHPREDQDTRTDYQARLERLPPGHPSSPYESDGSSRPPVPNLADRELPLPDESPGHADERSELEGTKPKVEPLTDAEYAEHVADVRERIKQARETGLATEVQYTIEPDHEIWTAEREALQDELIEDLYKQAADVPNDRRAIIAGGLPGAGKTTVLGEHAGIDRSQFLTINPDDIKEEMARRGLVPVVQGLTPMEASDLVHEESSHVAKRLARRALSDGKNVLWDITMSSPESTGDRVSKLRANDYYRIEGIFVDIPPEISASRAIARHRSDHEKYRAGEGQGGRLVPVEGIHARTDNNWWSSNRRTFEALKPDLDTWSIYDNSVDGRSAVLVETSHSREMNR